MLNRIDETEDLSTRAVMQPFRTILFAADFSESSVQAFRMACALAVENKTRLVLLHVIEPNLVAAEPAYTGEPTVPCFAAQRDASNHETLSRKMREVYVPGRPLELVYRTTEGAAATEIIRMAGEIGADLIVMGTHGRTGIRWLLAGSVAIAVLRGAHCPILALHAHELAHAGGRTLDPPPYRLLGRFRGRSPGGTFARPGSGRSARRRSHRPAQGPHGRHGGGRDGPAVLSRCP